MNSDEISVIEKILTQYQPSEYVRSLLDKSQLLLLVGISGAGKDTVKHELLKTDTFYDFISYTTRQPRANHGVMEQNDIDYHFIDIPEARRMLQKGEFIEAAQYSGNVYGTGIKDLERAVESQKVAVNDIEVQGVDQYFALSSKPVAIFLLPPSYDQWRERLQKRYGAENANSDNITQRLQTAAKELHHALSNPRYIFVINDELSETLREVNRIISDPKNAIETADARAVANALLERLKTTD